jgi:hypothetical protein
MVFASFFRAQGPDGMLWAAHHPDRSAPLSGSAVYHVLCADQGSLGLIVTQRDRVIAAIKEPMRTAPGPALAGPGRLTDEIADSQNDRLLAIGYLLTV